MVVYLTYQDIINIHTVQLRLYGGASGIRNQGSVLSVEQAPQQSVFGSDAYPTIFDKASVYAFNIAESQPFVDGNKRAGIGCAIQFLLYNDYYIDKSHDLALYQIMLDVANKTKTRKDLVKYLEANSYNCFGD